LAARFRAVHLDFGTGDGNFVRRSARETSDVLFVGVDAVAENLREASRRAAPNALFVRMALEDAPGDLAGIAHSLTVLFPWGSLLRAVADPDRDGLSRLRAICRAAAEVRFVFELTKEPSGLERAYRLAGFDLAGRPVTVEEARSFPTTWAKKLGFSGHPRSFWEFRGSAI
jgi:hypothetical protein